MTQNEIELERALTLAQLDITNAIRQVFQFQYPNLTMLEQNVVLANAVARWADAVLLQNRVLLTKTVAQVKPFFSIPDDTR